MNLSNLFRRQAQTAIEYLLLLTVVAVVIFVGVKAQNGSVLQRGQNAADGYYNTVTEVIMGKNPKSIDGGWCPPKPSGECECACPAPAFGGQYCVNNATCHASSGAPLIYCGDGVCTAGVETGEAGHPITGASPPDPLTTCFEDCPFQPDCKKCNDMVPVSTCGSYCPDDGTSGAVRCGSGQVCMVSDCGTACPGYKAPFCESAPLLCTASCRCDSLLVPAGKCGSKCGGYSIPISEKCYKFASCTGACTEFEMYVGKADNTCAHCSNLTQDADETGFDCGGADCPACCGNGRRDPGEACDSTESGCSSHCLPETSNCRPPSGIYTCDGPTDGVDSVTNQPCSIPKQCDPTEDINKCPQDCSKCTPNGNCVPENGKYQCGDFTRGFSENCPTIPCVIPKKCDPTESCTSCQQDCAPGACVADSTYQCGGPTQGHYANCPTLPCVIPQGCDVTETDQTCAADCKNSCTGPIPENTVACPGADQNVTTATPRKLVGNCTGAKCEYVCGDEYALRFRNGGLEKYCACVGTDCFNPNCQEKEITTDCDGKKVTLPATRDGQESVVACPEGCAGSIIGSCQKGQYADIYNGGCSKTAACPAISIPSNSTVTPNGVSVDCGPVSWNETPANTQGLASCGPNCDGYMMRFCDANGQWAEGYGQSWWGCRPKSGLSCSETSYTPHGADGKLLCGNAQAIHIPEMGNGKTFTSRCGGTCGSGTFSATCVDGTVFYHNNCSTSICGDGIRNGDEVCDGDTIACQAPEVGNKACLPDCSGYGECSSRRCADLEVSVGSCGNIKLPGVRTGDISSGACPNGCTGTIASQCSGSRFGSISGTCMPNGCQKMDLATACGTVTMNGTANGSSSSVDCPIGCTGKLTAQCTDGAFGTVSGFCQPDLCKATTVHTTCGDVIMPETSSGRSKTVQCPSCAGDLTATCTNGQFGVMTGPCAPGVCPAVTQNWGSDVCQVNASVAAASSGGTSTLSCGPSCTGTRTATCGDNGTWQLQDNCVPSYCVAPKTVSTSCGDVVLPGGILSGKSSSAPCPDGCTGSGVSAQCAKGSFLQPVVDCTPAACPSTEVPTACGAIVLPGAPNGLPSSKECPAGCTGSVSATCVNGKFDVTGTCTPITCPATLQNNGCSVEMEGTSGVKMGTCKGLGCSGILNATCDAGTWKIESGGCRKDAGPCTCESYTGGWSSATTRGACGGSCDNGMTCNSMSQCFHWACAPQGCINPTPASCVPSAACGCGDGRCTDPINEPSLCWTGSNDCCGDGICGNGETSSCPSDCCGPDTCDKQHANTGNYCTNINGSFSWMTAAQLKAACDGPEDCGNTKEWCAAGKTMQCKRNPTYGVYGFVVDQPTWPCP